MSRTESKKRSYGLVVTLIRPLLPEKQGKVYLWSRKMGQIMTQPDTTSKIVEILKCFCYGRKRVWNNKIEEYEPCYDCPPKIEALNQLITSEVNKARTKDPLKCEQGHPVISHNTADGWCCACEADIAFLNKEIRDHTNQLIKDYYSKTDEECRLARISELEGFSADFLTTSGHNHLLNRYKALKEKQVTDGQDFKAATEMTFIVQTKKVSEDYSLVPPTNKEVIDR